MPFRIREFAKQDFEVLWRIDQVCFDPQLAYSRLELAFYMRRPGAFTLVAERDASPDKPAADGKQVARLGARILGFITVEIRRNSGHIITIDVVPEARRDGIGSALLSAAEEGLRNAGAAEVTLETAVNNMAAIRFYRTRGYLVEKTIPRYYSNQLDAFFMRKELLVAVPESAAGRTNSK